MEVAGKKSIIYLHFLFLCLFPAPGIATTSSDSPFAEGRRVALLIGNDEYAEMALKNPARDSELLSSRLSSLGFETTLVKNASRREMVAAIKSFGKSLGENDVGLFFYAGHGFNYDNNNYFLPVDGIELSRQSPIRSAAVNVKQVLRSMGESNNLLNIVILDACRSIPAGLLSASIGQGLSEPREGGNEFYLAYSAQPGNVAVDGAGTHSPFAKALADQIGQAGLSINEVFQNVTKSVLVATDEQQRPMVSSTLTDNFYFSGAKGSEVSALNETVELENQRLKNQVLALAPVSSAQSKNELVMKMIEQCKLLEDASGPSLELANCYQGILDIDSYNLRATTELQLVSARMKRGITSALNQNKLQSAKRMFVELIKFTPAEQVEAIEAKIRERDQVVREERNRKRAIPTF